ncbi:MAG: hypothetical protein HYV13_02605 [Candidatus Doudnabacteria bacterium]|nr:hypothetical protein [Candidatus Doudnabacteria bacterium]
MPGTENLTRDYVFMKKSSIKTYRDIIFDQSITAAGMGCMAAMDAEKYLEMDHG